MEESIAKCMGWADTIQIGGVVKTSKGVQGPTLTAFVSLSSTGATRKLEGKSSSA